MIDELIAQAWQELEAGRSNAALLWSRVLVGAFANDDGLRLLAISAHTGGDLALAQDTYPRALEKFPRDLYLMAGYAELLLQLERYDDAVPWLMAAMEADPTASHPAGARVRLLIAKHKRRYSL